MGGIDGVRRAFTILTTREQPWRRHLLAARTPDRLPGARKLVASRERWLENALQRYPDLLFPFVLYLSESGRGENARGLVEAYQLEKSGSAQWQLAVAVCWYHFKEFQRGDLAIAQAEQLDPSSAEVQRVLARIHRERGNAFLDLQAHMKLIELEPEKRHEDIYVGMAVPLFNMERYQDVVDSLGHLRLKGRHWHTAYRLAASLEKTGKASEALEQYKLASRLAKLDGPTEHHVAVLHFRYGNLDRALDQFRSVGFSVNDPNAMIAWSRASRFARNYDESLAIGKRLTESHSTSAAAWLDYGTALHETQQHEEAVKAFRRASALAKGKDARTSLYYAFRSAIRSGQKELGLGLFALKPFAPLRPKAGRDEDVVALERRLLASTDLAAYEKTAYQLGVARLEAGDETGAIEAFIDVVGQQRPAYDQRDWQSAYELSKMEFYLEQLEAAPITDNLVLVESFLGRRVSCNPYALLLEGLRNPMLAALRFVVVTTENADIPSKLLDDPRVLFVERGTHGYLRCLARAEFLINNVTFPDYFVRREGQKYLNTWHGIPWKFLGRDIVDSDYSHGNVLKNVLAATHLALPDEHTVDVMVKRQGIANLITTVPAITGSPRLDSTLGMPSDSRRALRVELGVGADEEEKSIVLYAPTWREWADTLADPAEHVRAVVQALSAELPEAQIAVRAHHFLETAITNLEGANVVVVPNTIDTNDLLAATDVLVSDYSSIIFDFAATGRPIVKLVDDIARYRNERGLYFDAADVPGVSCETIEEMVACVSDIVNGANLPSDGGRFSDYEDGTASRRVWEYFYTDQLDEDRYWDGVPANSGSPKVLVSVSGLNPNGITRSLQSLVKNLNSSGVQPFVFVYPEVLRNPAISDIIEDIENNAEILPAFNSTYRTFAERAEYRIFNSAQNRRQFGETSALATTGRREFRRQFTNADFDSVIEFDGYNPNRTILSAFGSPAGRKVHVFHNEFRQEIASRFPRLRAALTVIGGFDCVASVSDAVRIENSLLLEEFGVEPTEHRVLRNTLDLERIRSMSEEPLRDDVRHWIHEQPDTTVAVMMGRLSPEKNHLEAFKALKATNAATSKQTRLLVLGDGPLRLQLARELQDLEMRDSVLLAGFDPNPYPALMAADAMFLPSLYEGQPIVLLESLTLGKPTVATNIPGSRSVLSGIEGAALVDCSFDGVRQGFELIAAGALETPHFDADAYNKEVVEESLELLLNR